MSSHLGLLMLLVRDVPRAKAFYTEYLGLEAVPELSSDEFVLLRSRSGRAVAQAARESDSSTSAGRRRRCGRDLRGTRIGSSTQTRNGTP